MPLFYDKEVKVFKTSCGPYDNNAYLIVCPQTNESIIIDPPMEPGQLLKAPKGPRVKTLPTTHTHRPHRARPKTLLPPPGTTRRATSKPPTRPAPRGRPTAKTPPPCPYPLAPWSRTAILSWRAQ